MLERLTIAGRQRTCSYCVIYFETVDKFSEHFDNCPVRIKHGYIMHKSVREAFRKCIEQLDEARARHEATSQKLEELFKLRSTPEYLNSKEYRDKLNAEISDARGPDGQAYMDYEEASQDYRTLVKYFGKPDCHKDNS